MTPRARWLAALFGTALAATCHAGPMGWTYTTVVTSLNGPDDPEIYLGSYRFSEGGGLRTVYGYVPVAAGVSGSGEGSTTTPVAIAETSRFGADLRDEAPPNELNAGLVNVVLTVTDTESGKSFGPSFSGLYEFAPAGPEDTASGFRLVLNPNDSPMPGRPSGIEPMILGRNRYDIYFGESVDRGDITGLGISIAVTPVEAAPPPISGTPTDTPEPATLVLGAIGVAAFLARRVRA